MKPGPGYRFLYVLMWPFFCLFHPLRVIGRENIPEGGAVICPNHSGLSDPVIACFAFTRRFKLIPMAKSELRKVPFLGMFLEKLGTVFVERGTADMKAVKETLRILKAGGKLLLFPEGTRIRNGVDKFGAPAQPKSGAAMFATRTNLPLVPMYIPEKKRWFCPTTVVIGQPYMPEYEGRKATAEELDAITAELMRRVYALKEGKSCA